MEKRIVYNQENGVMAVVVPVLKALENILIAPAKFDKKGVLTTPPEYRLETQEEMLFRIAPTVVPEGVEWRLVNAADIPTDDYFRNAWQNDQSSGKVEINMDKAREIHMQELRKLRDEKLAELDVETLKGNDVQEEKQILRDLPQSFDLSVAKNPEQLQALIPAELK